MEFNTEKNKDELEIVNEVKKDEALKKMRIPFWIWMGIVSSLILAVIFVSCYGYFEKRAKAFFENPVERNENINWLFNNNEILYHNLYNVINNTEISYPELYYSLKEEMGAETDYTEDGEESTEEAQESYESYLRNVSNQAIRNINSYYSELESQFADMNSNYDFFIRDNSTGTYLTNTAETEGLNPDSSYFYLNFKYDKNGNVTIGEHLISENAHQVRKTASEVIRVKAQAFEEDSYLDSGIHKTPPVDCTITYAISFDSWKKIQDSGGISGNSFWWNQYSGYVNSGVGHFYLLFLLISIVLGFVFPKAGREKPWNTFSMCKLPLEVLTAIGIIIISIGDSILTMIIKYSSLIADLSVQMPPKLARFLIWGGNVLFMAALLWGAWYLGICIRGVREYGIWRYIKMRSLTYRFFPYIKSKILATYDALIHLDVTRNARKHIFKIVLINAVILFVISSLWFGGIAITVVYSIILYFILKKYVSDLQKKYGILLGATNSIAEGNLNVVITEDIGIFEPFKYQVIRIQNGFRNAVEEEVKSQRMKAELITNVSHDLKTPLTAIITYIGLLQNEKITQEQRQEYLATLEKKSLRLKVLIEDLFEVSKATSKTVTLNIMDVDIMNLVKQVELEMSDKLKASNLEVKMNLSESRIILPLDSQKTFRIYENLFGNIAKYAMPGTRVYVNGFQIDDIVAISFRNISAAEILVSPQELTDRFVRGDSSRNTEGSGLGLAIAKSFVELQNGHFEIELDGDLFKVTTKWRIPAAEQL